MALLQRPPSGGFFFSAQYALVKWARRRAPRVEQMRAEYDFDYSKAERGKYFKRLLKEGSNGFTLRATGDVAALEAGSRAANAAVPLV
jgi:hypothetical protein